MRSRSELGVAMAAMLCLAAVSTSAQTTTSSSGKKFEVVAVNGNDVVVKLDEGARELLKVPDDVKFFVGGQPLSVHELKAGMSGTAAIPAGVKMTPVTVTQIKDGTVIQANASEVVVQTAQGTQTLKPGELDPNRGLDITRSGKAAQMSELRSGDRLTATIIHAVPQVAESAPVQPPVARRAQPEPLPAPPIVAAPVPDSEPTPVGTSGFEPAPEATTAQDLPKTAGSMPLLGLAGVSALFVGVMLSARRRRRAE